MVLLRAHVLQRPGVGEHFGFRGLGLGLRVWGFRVEGFRV